ncbi:MAG: hypothetical protein JWN77_4 [Frankiales bacterium]|jgi:hypothetical protein|nr:hypothetical protein [Frankiales bacterium]
MTRWLARLLATVVVACGLVPLTAGASWACSCAAPTTTERQQWTEIALAAPEIYLAEVVARTGGDVVDANGNSTTGTYTYQLRVTDSLKGGALGTRFVTTSWSGASCGATVREDRPLLVYAQVLSLCGGGFTQERVAQRAAIIRAAVRAGPGPVVVSDPLCAFDGKACIGRVHRVQRGEWLWKIARAEMARQGLSSRDLGAVRAYANRIYRTNAGVIGADPNRLRAGARLVLPSVR